MHKDKQNYYSESRNVQGKLPNDISINKLG